MAYVVKLRLVFLLFCCSAPSFAAKKTYKGFKIYEVLPRERSQSDLLHSLLDTEIIFDFLHPPIRELNTSNRVIVDPIKQDSFEQILNNNTIKFKVINHDIYETIKKEQMPVPRSLLACPFSQFKRYLRSKEINSYLDSLAKQYPWRVKVETVGKSFEGRPIKTIRISNGLTSATKPIILIDAGIHAREWLAPASALYVIRKLVEKFEKNMKYLIHFDWVIMPLINPDGYEFSHTDDRMWRKTRKPNKIPQCRGTDANRNFDIHWGGYTSSIKECSDLYQGSRPMSEPEVQTLQSVMLALKDKCQMYLSLHSYGSFIFYPRAWSKDRPLNWKKMHEVAQAGADAIGSNFNQSYRIGNSGRLLYRASGTSADYAFDKVGIPIALTMELPFAGTGFDPHPKDIKRMVKETWVGIKAMAAKLAAQLMLNKRK